MKKEKDYWTRVVLESDASLTKVLEVMNKSPLKIILVVSSEGKLLGTVSDGDIRRGILKGFSLSSSVASIMNSSPITVIQSSHRDQVLDLMKTNGIQYVPIVDDKSTLIGLHTKETVSSAKQRDNWFVIMAGGKGTRLLPTTQHTPKPMLPIAGKPVLEHIIERAIKHGFSNFLIAIHHLGTVIEDYFRDGSKLGVRIEYLRETFPLGTAGPLSLMKPSPSRAFLVTNGDVISDISYGDFLDFHLENEAKATMAVQIRQWQNPYGVVNTKGFEIVSLEEKPFVRWLVNAGVYAFDPSVLSILRESVQIDMPAFFDLIRFQNMRTMAYPLIEDWADIGSPEEYLKILEMMKNSDGRLNS